MIIKENLSQTKWYIKFSKYGNLNYLNFFLNFTLAFPGSNIKPPVLNIYPANHKAEKASCQNHWFLRLNVKKITQQTGSNYLSEELIKADVIHAFHRLFLSNNTSSSYCHSLPRRAPLQNTLNYNTHIICTIPPNHKITLWTLHVFLAP